MSLSKRDNTFGRARDLGLLGSTRSLRGAVSKKDKQDFFELSLRGSSSFSLSLKRLTDNADVFLYNQNRRLIGASRQKGKKNESIATNLDDGTYYVKVQSRSSRDRINYRLGLAARPIIDDENGGIPGGTTSPVLVNSNASVRKGGAATIDGTLLKTIDAEQSAGQLTYTLTSLPQHGTLFLNGQPLVVNSTFTQADIDLGTVSYQSLPTAVPLDGSVIAIEGNQIILSKPVGEDAELFLFDGSTGRSTQLTNNTVNDELLAFNGSTAVWQSRLDTVGNELFFYNKTTGQTKQLTNSPTETPNFQRLIGSKVFWLGPPVSDVRHKRLYSYDTANANGRIEQIGGGDVHNVQFDGSLVSYNALTTNNRSALFFYNSETKTSTRLSHANANPATELFVDADETYVLWKAVNPAANPSRADLFLTNITTNQTRLLLGGGGSLNNVYMSGPNVAWTRYMPRGGEAALYFYNGTTGTTVNLFDNPAFSVDIQETFKGLVGSNVVWSSFVGTDTELRLYNGRETIALTDGDNRNDTFLGMDDSTILWQTENQIFAYNIATKGPKQLISNGNRFNTQKLGTNLLWTNENGDLFYYSSDRGQTAQLTSAASPYDIRQITTDGINVYWTNTPTATNPYLEDLFFYNGATNQTTWLFRDTSLYSIGLQGKSGSNVVLANTGTGDLFYSNGSFTTADHFNFTVSDGVGGLTSGTFTLTVA